MVSHQNWFRLYVVKPQQIRFRVFRNADDAIGHGEGSLAVFNLGRDPPIGENLVNEVVDGNDDLGLWRNGRCFEKV